MFLGLEVLLLSLDFVADLVWVLRRHLFRMYASATRRWWYECRRGGQADLESRTRRRELFLPKAVKSREPFQKVPLTQFNLDMTSATRQSIPHDSRIKTPSPSSCSSVGVIPLAAVVTLKIAQGRLVYVSPSTRSYYCWSDLQVRLFPGKEQLALSEQQQS